MEQRISVVTLGVTDLKRAKEFYATGLGWSPVFEDEEIVFFQAGGMIFGLYVREQLAADMQVAPNSLGRAAMALGHNVRSIKEVSQLLEKAAAAGGKILKPASKAPWGGYSGYFADPDGFAWEVAWNPVWIITADGSVRFR